MQRNRLNRRCLQVALWSSVLAGLTLGGATRSATAEAGAHVTQETIERPYWVSGATVDQLVDFMRRYPLRGAQGAQLASIRPRYNLKVATSPGAGCTVRSVNMHIEFTVTLPRARQEKAMKARSRRLWNSFTEFARNHEFEHRRIYLGCARSFAAKARHTPKMASCGGLKSQVRQQMFSAMQACSVKHQALDQGAMARLKRLPLLRAANIR